MSPEQSEELAFTVSESLPESSNDVAEAYVQNLIDSESENNNESALENIPEHAVDVASTFIDSFPEVASDMVDILQDFDDIEESELSHSLGDKPSQSIVELQLQEAVLTQSGNIKGNH